MGDGRGVQAPLPVPDLRQVLPVLVDVLLVLDELVLHELLQYAPLVPRCGSRFTTS